MTTTTEAGLKLRVATVKETYPSALRPATARNAAFWTGDDEARTFFALTGGAGAPLLVVNTTTDPRAEGFRAAQSVESEMLRNLGLMPTDHLVWTVEESYLAFAEEDAPSAEDPFASLRAERDAALAQVESLKEALSRGDVRVREAQSRHQSDIDAIGARLLEECEARDWCEEFDRIIDELNGSLNRSLPQMVREREYEVTMDVTVRVTRTVTASDEDNAYEQARDDLGSEDLRYGDVQDTDHVETTEA